MSVNNQERLQQIIALIDLTSLNDNDDAQTIATLCEKAQTPLGPVAAVCIYPQFIAQAKDILAEQGIRIATVVNFPHGTDSLETSISNIQTAIDAGADEIDIVMPYLDYKNGHKETVCQYIQACKETCGKHTLLKVILETSEFNETTSLIYQASIDMLISGADFIKTSTGKTKTGASFDASADMLQAIKGYRIDHKRQVGFKASGGIRTLQDALIFLDLAERILGTDWPTPATFRFGASSLLDNLCSWPNEVEAKHIANLL